MSGVRYGSKEMDIFGLGFWGYGSVVASWWAGCALAHPEFGSSVNSIPTTGADYAHHITACPLRFENLVASRQYY